MSENSENIDKDTLIDNLRRSNKLLFRRFFVILTMCIIANSLFISEKIKINEKEEFGDLHSLLRTIENSAFPSINIIQNKYDVQRLASVMEWYQFAEDMETDSLKQRELLDSANTIMNSKFRELYSNKEFEKISFFGISLNTIVWNAFSPIIFTLIFLNFSNLLRYRDTLLKELAKKNISIIEVGPEFFEIYSPLYEFKYSKLPSISSIIFILFLLLVMFTSIIVPIGFGNLDFPVLANFLYDFNKLLILVVVFKSVSIAFRQNLLGIKSFSKFLIGTHYFDKSRKTYKDVIRWSIPFILLNLSLLVILVIQFNSFKDDGGNFPQYYPDLFWSYFKSIGGAVIGTIFLPLGLLLYANYYKSWLSIGFEILIFVGAVAHVFTFTGILVGLFYPPVDVFFFQYMTMLTFTISGLSYWIHAMFRKDRKNDNVLKIILKD